MTSQLEVASGWSGAEVTEHRLYEAAAALVPAVLPARTLAALDLSHLEDLARGGGYVRGVERASRYALVVHEADLAIAKPLCANFEDRKGEVAVLGPTDTLGGWYRGREEPPRAVFVVGTAIPWSETVQLQQLAPVFVSRLPLCSASDAGWWEQRADHRWLVQAEARKRAWIVSPAHDLFTRRLAEFVVGPLRRALGALRFAPDPLRPPGDDEEVGLVVLLTHGDDLTGAPVVDAATHDRVLAACARGAIIVHLGCHGAGRVAGDRYGDLASRLDVPQPRVPRDAHATFARACLLAGAAGVIAHLDATWSKTFEDPSALIHALEGIAEGTATASFATHLLVAEANRCAAAAVDHCRAGDLAAGGRAWLRHLDLSGFVCLGDVREAPRWRDDEPA